MPELSIKSCPEESAKVLPGLSKVSNLIPLQAVMALMCWPTREESDRFKAFLGSR